MSSRSDHDSIQLPRRGPARRAPGGPAPAPATSRGGLIDAADESPEQPPPPPRDGWFYPSPEAEPASGDEGNWASGGARVPLRPPAPGTLVHGAVQSEINPD